MPDLPDIGTDAGVLARLMIAETHNPNFPDYSEDDAKMSFRFMQAVVNNRLNNNPAQFGAPGATTLTDIITAQNQFNGFSKVDGQVQIDPGISANIDDVMQRANTGAAGPFTQFVQNILDRVNGPVNDPQAGVMSINGTALVGGTFGWKTANKPSPGPRFFAIPPELGGVLMGNQFYALLQSANLFEQVISMSSISQRGMEQVGRLMEAVMASASCEPAKRFWFPQGVDVMDTTVKLDLKEGFTFQLKIQGPTGNLQALSNENVELASLKEATGLAGVTIPSALEFAVAMERLAPPPPTVSKDAPKPGVAPAEHPKALRTPTLDSVANFWANSCAGGDRYENNCAHFLSDAFMRAGYTELSPQAACINARCATSAKRPVRARDMWCWFQQKKTSETRTLQKGTGWWAVFQLNEKVYWGGHVVLFDSDKWTYYGTGWYPDWDQYLYKW